MTTAVRKAETRAARRAHRRPKKAGGYVKISRDDYEKLRQGYEAFKKIAPRLENIEDARLLSEAAAKHAPDDYLPAELVRRILAGESPVRVWREHRGMTPANLAAAAGVSKSYLCEIETGKKPGSVAALTNIAKALRASVGDLIDE